MTEWIGLFSLLTLVARRVAKGTSSIGDMVTLHNYWATLINPLYQFGRSYNRLNQDLVRAERLLRLLNQQPSVKDSPDAQVLDNASGNVEFEDVQFNYPGRETLLSKFNLATKTGQMIAFVGETGGGKSTILQLLMRFYDVTAGKITLDGHDLREIKLESLRGCFGLVPQDTVLFNTSILENVRFGNIDETNDEVFAACRAAAIHEKILTFPRGYASRVGERGVRLSGGERQRVAIARVLEETSDCVAGRGYVGYRFSDGVEDTACVAEVDEREDDFCDCASFVHGCGSGLYFGC